jgi:hypothetical protein
MGPTVGLKSREESRAHAPRFKCLPHEVLEGGRPPLCVCGQLMGLGDKGAAAGAVPSLPRPRASPVWRSGRAGVLHSEFQRLRCLWPHAAPLRRGHCGRGRAGGEGPPPTSPQPQMASHGKPVRADGHVVGCLGQCIGKSKQFSTQLASFLKISCGHREP